MYMEIIWKSNKAVNIIPTNGVFASNSGITSKGWVLLVCVAGNAGQCNDVRTEKLPPLPVTDGFSSDVQRCVSILISLLPAWTKCWTNSRGVAYLRHHDAYPRQYEIIIDNQPFQHGWQQPARFTFNMNVSTINYISREHRLISRINFDTYAYIMTNKHCDISFSVRPNFETVRPHSTSNWLGQSYDCPCMK